MNGSALFHRWNLERFRTVHKKSLSPHSSERFTRTDGLRSSQTNIRFLCLESTPPGFTLHKLALSSHCDTLFLFDKPMTVIYV